ncbi:DUF3990 domain-containing protein [Hespellia stercorisuis]|uniref:DUF3990 domain-containing protein n=1 Tax=Hespellia stercorisuis DSM 15480 TaxID=1121950 RepID=A0A1M6K011_9FIRM|nr:DUF3990 domain-containing protein [Hespellia stercorisuis]SHJ52267.1 Protein of unknown function [Hespellia stercorisuis DSM 15480]
MILYHGSSEIIQKPIYGKGKEYNDYGKGFYCTEHMELAREWACTEEQDGYANKYEFDLNQMKILNLFTQKDATLCWLALLTEYREIRLSTPVMKQAYQWLQSNYHLDIQEYDVIIGYRADDSYFSFARAFLNNTISFGQLSYAMRLGKLGEQYVLKSEKAFRTIQFVDAIRAEREEYFVKRKSRDDDAREAFFREMNKADMEGTYVMDLIRNEVSRDDPRIQ